MTDLTLIETKDLLVELQRRFQAAVFLGRGTLNGHDEEFCYCHLLPESPEEAVFLCRMLDEFVMDELRQAKRELRPWEGL